MGELFSSKTRKTFSDMPEVMKSLRYLGSPDSSVLFGLRGDLDPNFGRPEWDMLKPLIDCHYNDEGLGEQSDRPSMTQLSKLKLPSYSQLLSAYLLLRKMHMESKGVSKNGENVEHKIAEKLYEIDSEIASKLTVEPHEYFKEILLSKLKQSKDDKNLRSPKSGENRLWSKTSAKNPIRDWTTKIGLKDGFVFKDDKVIKNIRDEKHLKDGMFLVYEPNDEFPEIEDGILFALSLTAEELIKKEKEAGSQTEINTQDLNPITYQITLTAVDENDCPRYLRFWLLITREPKPSKPRTQERPPLRGAYVYYACEVKPYIGTGEIEMDEVGPFLGIPYNGRV